MLKHFKLTSVLHFVVALCLGVLFCVASVVFAANPTDVLGPIRQIVVTGQKKIEKDAVLAKLKSKTGEQALRSTIADDIRSVHGLGFFDDVSVDYTDGVLTYTIKERPTIVAVEFDGNEQLSNSDLKEVVKVKEYSILDVNKVKEDITLIQKSYEEKGFYLARVNYELQPGANPDEVRLVYKINDYEKVRIKKITFINNKKFNDDKLKSVFRNTKEGNFFSWISSSGSFRESAFKQDLQILTYFYLNEGYVKFHYETPVVTVSDDKKWLFISIYVDEGEQYAMGDIDFGGDLLFEKQELHDTIQLKSGMTFAIQKRNDDIQKLTEKYQDLGYAFVNVNPKMNVHEDTRLVDIRYDFEKGNLVYFGEVNIVGNSKTRDKVIRRELRIREGELYNGTRFRKSKERVERLGYFAQGEVVFNTVTPKGKSDLLDVEVSVKERSTGTVTVGMGYGSIQKFFLTAQIAEINLFGRGQNLSLSGQYAADRRSRSINLGFTEPYFLDTAWSAGSDIYFMSFPIPNRYLEFKKGFDLRFGHPLTDDINAFLTYKLENLRLEELANASVDVSSDIGNLSSIGLSVVRDLRNNRFETTEGNYESIATEWAGVGGDKYFAKVLGNARYYHSLFETATFRTNFELGHIFKTVGNRNVPPSERFYLGGPNNLKGFNPLTVTPSKNNIPIGGVSEFTYTVEIELPLIREAGLKFVTFYDMGNSYESFDDLVGVRGVKKDVGFGFRWFSPIGPLRFEWGFPIGPKPGEDNMVFNFFIGPPF